MKKHFIFMVPKKELTFVLPYLGKISLDLRTRLRGTIERDLPCCKLIVIFRSKCTLSILLQFKDSLVVIARLLITKNLPPLLYHSS